MCEKSRGLYCEIFRLLGLRMRYAHVSVWGDNHGSGRHQHHSGVGASEWHLRVHPNTGQWPPHKRHCLHWLIQDWSDKYCWYSCPETQYAICNYYYVSTSLPTRQSFGLGHSLMIFFWPVAAFFDVTDLNLSNDYKRHIFIMLIFGSNFLN